jgi:multiple sugar transport system permease protein
MSDKHNKNDIEELNNVSDQQPDEENQEFNAREYEEYALRYYEEYGVFPEGYEEYYESYYGSYRTTNFDTTPEFENLTKKQIKEIDKRNKAIRKQYHVSNFQILKNYKKYSDAEKEHYRYLFGRRIASAVWPFFHYVILIGLAFVILYPILFMITNSIRPQIETTDPSIMWIPKTLRFENFVETFDAIITAQGHNGIILNTFVINIGCSLVQVVTCALTGYGFARFKFKGRSLLFGIVVLQMIVPIQIIMIPVFLQFRYFDFFGLLGLIPGMEAINLINKPITMFIMAFFVNGIRSGLFILLFRQFFRGLPKELEDAAYLDGCGPLETFMKVMVPNAFVSFLTVFIFSVVWYWNDSFVTGMLINNSPTISLAIENLWQTMAFYFNGTTENVGTASSYIVWVQAGCLMAITPILVMYIFLQKHFVEGVERSGIVG